AADLLRLERLVFIGDGIEDRGIDTAAAGLLTPGQVHRSAPLPQGGFRGKLVQLRWIRSLFPRRRAGNPCLRPRPGTAVGSAGWPGSPLGSSTRPDPRPSTETVRWSRS